MGYDRLRTLLAWTRLPARVRRIVREDRRGPPAFDPGPDAAVAAALDWLCVAQDRSGSRDGGVARHYSLLHGWSPSYPETTGYIVPTFLACARLREAADLRARARRMLDWLVSIQLPSGAFQGGRVDSQPKVPVVFNTGQILLGLASGVSEFGDAYLEPMRRAARWLVEAQDRDGCWRKHASPFASPGEKTYDTHAAWGLLEAARVDPSGGFAEAGIANVDWALRQQREDGWFDRCCLSDATQPLTHTIGYALRGVLEAYAFSREPRHLEAARRTADRLAAALAPDGFLPGLFRDDWRGAARWSCLTGTAQIACCWFLLYRFTGDPRYREAGRAANRFVRRTILLEGAPELRGGVKGSYPVDGSYCRFEFPSWGAKFAVDANLFELAVRDGTVAAGGVAPR
jgi:hypothetical protein